MPSLEKKLSNTSADTTSLALGSWNVALPNVGKRWSYDTGRLKFMPVMMQKGSSFKIS